MRLPDQTKQEMRKTALGRFLLRNRISLRTAAKGIGCSHPAVREWAIGLAVPESATIRLRIETWTNGAVPASCWISRDVQRAMSKVTPFRPVAKVG